VDRRCRRSGRCAWRAGDRAQGKVELELVLGEVSFGCNRGLDLDPRVDPGGVQAGQQWPGAIGAITIDGGRGRWPATTGLRRGRGCRPIAVDLVDQFGQQLRRRGRVAKVARGGGGRGNQLAVGVDRGMPLVAVKATGAGLWPWRASGSTPRSPGRRRPYRRSGSCHRRPAPGLGRRWRPAAERPEPPPPAAGGPAGPQHPVGVPGGRIHQHRSCRLVVPVDRRLGQAGAVVGTGKHPPSSAANPSSATLSSPRDGRAQQRDGVHGRHRVIQRCGVQHPPHPTSPAWLAASMVTARSAPAGPRRPAAPPCPPARYG
jgi:hypothetical protein